jgi:hypothetical protein
MSDSGNICLSCGLCCDGTLIGFVQLEKNEVSSVTRFMEVDVVNGNGIFLQPCDKYCDGCTIYSNRPNQCASFNCDLLKSIDEKELAFNSAIEIVLEVKQRRAIIEDKLTNLQIELKSESFYFKMIELKKWLQNAHLKESFSKSQHELGEDLIQLDNLMSKRFGVSLF